MYNTEGIELCHPNPSLIGTRIDAGNSTFSGSEKKQCFQKLLNDGQSKSGIRTFRESANRGSEIVSVYPVRGTEWMLASHANINVIQMQLDNLYQKFWVGTLLLVIIITGICFWLIRLIHRKYEQEMELRISGLNEEVNNLGMLWIYGFRSVCIRLSTSSMAKVFLWAVAILPRRKTIIKTKSSLFIE